LSSASTAKKIGVCKYCGKRKQLVDAHIVPRAFYPTKSDIKVLSKHTARTPWARKGVYDNAILCADCDGTIGVYDDYAAKVLRAKPKRADLYRTEEGLIAKGNNTRRFGYWIRNPDVNKLQAFSASLVWRAGQTTRSEMSIKLGDELLARARRVMEADSDSFFSVVAVRCADEELSKFVAKPTLFVSEPATGVQFFMSGFVLNVFERRPLNWKPSVEPIFLGAQHDWLVGYMPFYGSKFQEALREIIDARMPSV
jgi:hypothetical protein